MFNPTHFLTQRLAWWTVTSRIARGFGKFLQIHPAILAALIIVCVLAAHPDPIYVMAALLWIHLNCFPMARAIRFIEVVGKYLIVCNPARFSKEAVEDAIMTLMRPDVAKALSKVYGPQQVLMDIIAAESILHGPKPTGAGTVTA